MPKAHYEDPEIVRRYAKGPVAFVPGYEHMQRMAAQLIHERIGGTGEVLVQSHGIYVHSKAAIFLRNSEEGHLATVGSANLLPRSLRPDGNQPDTESNVWWSGNQGIERWYNQLVSEHTGFTIPHNGVHDGLAVRNFAFDQLNRVRTGSKPLGHLVRLDLEDRWDHLD